MDRGRRERLEYLMSDTPRTPRSGKRDMSLEALLMRGAADARTGLRDRRCKVSTDCERIFVLGPKNGGLAGRGNGL